MPMRPSKTLGGSRLKAARCVGIFKAWFSWLLPFITNRARTSTAPALSLTVPCEICTALKTHSLISTSIACASILQIGNDIFQSWFSIANAQSCLVSCGATLLLEWSGSEPPVAPLIRSQDFQNYKIGVVIQLPNVGFRFTSCRPQDADLFPEPPGPRSFPRGSSWPVRNPG
jgi:hypothetical protein